MEMDRMEERNGAREYRRYTDEELNSMGTELQTKLDILNDNFRGNGGGMPPTVRVEAERITGILGDIALERLRRLRGQNEAETSFTDNDDGKTVTISRSGASVEVPGIPPAPEKHDVTTFKRMRTMDKKTFLRDILGSEIRAGDGPRSKELLGRVNVSVEDGSAEFDGVRIFVKRGRGMKQVGLTEDKKMQRKVDEFVGLLKKAEDERGLPVVDPQERALRNIRGLSERENREMAGVLNPGPSTIRSTRIGDNGALQIHVEYLQETINETNHMIDEGDVGSIQEFELRERVVGLEDARDRAISQREREEVREIQEEDITRLERFKEWMKENWLGASALAAGVAGLITTIIIGARTAAVKGAGAVKSFAKAVRDAIKKLGPWAVPIANFLYTLRKGGAAVIGWLTSNLCVLVIALTWFIYDQYKERGTRNIE